MAKFKYYISIILVSIFLVLPLNTYGSNLEKVTLPNQLINPGSFYYPFKRIWEKLVDKVIFSSPKKINYHNYLLDVRLTELKYVVTNKLLGEFQKSSERLSYQAGILTDLVSKSERKTKDEAVEKFAKYIQTLTELRDQNPANSSYWLLIQHDMNSLKILSDRLK